MRRRTRGERGSSMAEMMIAVTLFLVVSAGLFDALAAYQRQDDRNATVTQVRRELRNALDSVARDLRATQQIGALGSTVGYASSLDVLTVAPDGVTQLPVRWRIAGTSLVREPLGALGGVASSSAVSLRSIVATTVLFRYFDDGGNELLPGVASVANLTGCTALIRITLASSPGANRPASQVTTDVALRNHLQGSLGC